MRNGSLFHGPIVDDFRRWLLPVTLHKSTSGAPKSSCSRPTGWARTRSCAGRPSQRPVSGDGKSQIQALDRTQPGLPMKPGRAGTMTHDYKRHGTTTLFAALNVLDGTVIGHNMKRHRHQEFIRFLNAIEAQVPARKRSEEHTSAL